MAGYSKAPLWKKLGYKDKLRAYVENAPFHHKAGLDLPADLHVRWAKRPGKDIGFIHLFATSKRVLSDRVRALRKIVADDAVVWISWPKKGSGVMTDLTEDQIRKIALPLGFVDIKVCAVDEIWSGLKLMVRRELRESRD